MVLLSGGNMKFHLAFSTIGLTLVLFSAQLTMAEDKKPSVVKEDLSRLAQMLYEQGFKSCSGELDKSVKWVHSEDGVSL